MSPLRGHPIAGPGRVPGARDDDDLPRALVGYPRWTQTCGSCGKVDVQRAPARPAACECGAKYDEPRVVHGSRGRKRPSGDAAHFTEGDG